MIQEGDQHNEGNHESQKRKAPADQEHKDNEQCSSADVEDGKQSLLAWHIAVKV